MIRIGRVRVKGRAGLCLFWTVVENGIGVLARWRFERHGEDGVEIYERAA